MQVPSRLIMKKVFRRQEIQSRLTMGIASLHAWIRFMEWTLKIAFRIVVGARKGRFDQQQKDDITANEKRIKKELKEKLGLRVFEPRQKGSGNSNDGNTAGRYFKNYKIVAKVTGVDEALLKKLLSLTHSNLLWVGTGC